MQYKTKNSNNHSELALITMSRCIYEVHVVYKIERTIQVVFYIDNKHGLIFSAGSLTKPHLSSITLLLQCIKHAAVGLFLAPILNRFRQNLKSLICMLCKITFSNL